MIIGAFSRNIELLNLLRVIVKEILQTMKSEHIINFVF